MAKDYAGTAREVLKLVGGEENITHLEHCSTRLRFSIADGGKVEKDKLKAVSGVMGVIASGNQCQVVIGNDVIEVYDELMKMGKFTGGNAAPASGEKKEQDGGAVFKKIDHKAVILAKAPAHFFDLEGKYFIFHRLFLPT